MAGKQLVKQNAQPVRKVFVCPCCGKEYYTQPSNFQKCGSELYAGNGGFLTVCNSCIDDLYAKYFAELDDENAAAKLLCSKLDVYWDPTMFTAAKPSDKKSSIYMYMVKLHRLGFYVRTYSDSEKERRLLRMADGVVEDDNDFIVTAEVRNFWGDGFTAKQYSELETIFKRWTGDRVMSDSDEIGLYRSISITDWQIMNAARTGGKTEQLTQALNSLLGKTRITKLANTNDIQPIGPKIRDWETERPIPEPSEEFKDVDGIVRYVTTWFISYRPNTQRCVFA